MKSLKSKITALATTFLASFVLMGCNGTYGHGGSYDPVLRRRVPDDSHLSSRQSERLDEERRDRIRENREYMERKENAWEEGQKRREEWEDWEMKRRYPYYRR